MAPAPITSKNEPRPHTPRANDHPAARRTAQRLRRRLDPPGRAAVLALADAIQHQRQLHLAPRPVLRAPIATFDPAHRYIRRARPRRHAAAHALTPPGHFRHASPPSARLRAPPLPDPQSDESG